MKEQTPAPTMMIFLNSLASDWQADTVGAGGDTTTGGGGVVSDLHHLRVGPTDDDGEMCDKSITYSCDAGNGQVRM
ncbi:hypothetical protein Tco_1042659 [Tanacetum coccineum]|uniref:Uncharacterized protein n=1 Tax=Tanacetum coccineum TaxID=301880 RepID=A0ABQ5GL54_9ASTR